MGSISKSRISKGRCARLPSPRVNLSQRLTPELLSCMSLPRPGSQKRAVHSEFPCSSSKEASAWCSDIGIAVTEARASCPIKWKGVCEATVPTRQSSRLPLGGSPWLQCLTCISSLSLAPCCADLAANLSPPAHSSTTYKTK